MDKEIQGIASEQTAETLTDTIHPGDPVNYAFTEPYPTVLHEIDAEGYHRIIVNNIPGEWYPKDCYAQHGDYIAINPVSEGFTFPEVFTFQPASFVRIKPSTRVEL